MPSVHLWLPQNPRTKITSNEYLVSSPSTTFFFQHGAQRAKHPHSSYATFQFQAHQLVHFWRKLEREFVKHFPTKPTDDHPHRLFRVKSSLLEIKQLVFPNFGCTRLVLDACRGILHLKIVDQGMYFWVNVIRYNECTYDKPFHASISHPQQFTTPCCQTAHLLQFGERWTNVLSLRFIVLWTARYSVVFTFLVNWHRSILQILTTYSKTIETLPFKLFNIQFGHTFLARIHV